tara:strand:+ start:281 stop:1177 length:897 start_codon:yes stop_codon:yes gene_type:complete
MSISRQNLTVVIVTFKSEHVIHDCIQSIPDKVEIIVVDNSNDKKFKESLEKRYHNVRCILSSKNLGMGAGNNLGLKNVETDFALILNPDVTLEKDAIDEIMLSLDHLSNFSLLAPISNSKRYPNYKIDKKMGHSYNEKKPFKVKSIDGFAMFFNLKKINKYQTFSDSGYFDENIFMYLENDDLCKRLIDIGEDIFIVPTSKINHLGAQAVNKKFKEEIELSRNWHWIWSKFYFNKKHFGFFPAIIDGLPTLISALIKYFFYSILLNKRKKNIYRNRVSGFVNSLLGKKSWYRPNLDQY